MKANLFLKMLVLSAIVFVASFTASAHSLDGQLIYNPVEENGVMVGQTVYKMESGALANYMKYNYKYDDSKRMIQSESMKWDSSSNQWENDLRIDYLYSGKSVTTHYYKWSDKKNAYILAPEMTVTMDNTDL